MNTASCRSTIVAPRLHGHSRTTAVTLLAGLFCLMLSDTGRAAAPEGGFEKHVEMRTNELNGTAFFSMGPHGDWEFSGVVQNKMDYDVDYFVTCWAESSEGELFQASVAGVIGDQGYVEWPGDGRPRIAGRNPEIAAHWWEVGLGESWCEMGSNKHHGSGPSVDDLLGSASKAIGLVSTVVTLFAAIL